MRVAIVFCKAEMSSKLESIAKSLSRGIESQGHQVDVINAAAESDKKISMYDYLAFGTEAVNFFGGKIPEQFISYIKQCGVVSGKRTFAFTDKKGLRTIKTLSALMKTLEKEGIFLKNSEVIATPVQAEQIGKRLHIQSSD